MNTGLTCITCHLVFSTNELQKSHYQSEWHRYNLKRQAVEMPPISLEDYDKRVTAFNASNEVKVETTSLYCTACKKAFSSNNSYESHIRSKKHLEESQRTKKKGPKQPRKKSASVSTTATVEEKKEKEEEEEENMEVEEGGEETDEEEWHTDHGTDEEDEDDVDLREHEALAVTSCLFCPTSSSSLDASLSHMSFHHGFSIPDKEFCSDLNGLVEYLGLKVGAGRMCLFCPERRSSFSTVYAVQAHMRDKEHCKVPRDADTMLELADFYDYDAMYDKMEETEGGPVEDDGWMLTLPSGAKIGHRSLVRFFRQNLNQVENLGPGKSRAAIEKAKGIYSALAWTGCNGVVATKAAKDLKYMAQVRRRFELRVGLKSNKLFKSRGRSDQ